MEEVSSAEYTTESLTEKLHELLNDSDNDANQFSFKEETIEQLMQEFYKEIIPCPKQATPTTPVPPKVEEIPPVVELHRVGSTGEFAGVGVVEEYKMEELEEEEEDEGDFDDEWLARVLNWGGNVDTNNWF